MGLRGESQVSNDFPKIVDKIPDERRLNRGKPGLNWNAGVFQRAVRLPTYTKQYKRSWAATCTGDYCTEVAAHAPGGLPYRQVSWHFVKMTRVLRQSVVIDSRVLSQTLKRLRRLLTIRLRSEEDECRFIYILAEGGDILKHEDFWLYAGACGSRKTIVRFLSAHRASLLTAPLAEVLHGRFNGYVGFSESLRICLQSSYSRPCGGY